MWRRWICGVTRVRNIRNYEVTEMYGHVGRDESRVTRSMNVGGYRSKRPSRL